MKRILIGVMVALAGVVVVSCSASKQDEKVCWICKRTETDLLKKRDALIKELATNIAENEKRQQEIKDKLIKSFNDKKPTVTSIGTEYVKMSFLAFKENRPSLLKLEPKLQVLYEYYDDYYLDNKTVDFKTIQDIADAYQNEPLEERYSKLIAEMEAEKTELQAQKSRLESMHTFFAKKTILPADIDRAYQKPKNADPAKTHALPTFSSLGMDLEQEVYLCPYCAALLAEASAGKFNLYNDLYAAQNYVEETETDDTKN